MSGLNFEAALENLSRVIQREARRFQFLLESDRLTALDKRPLQALFNNEISQKNQRNCLMLLSELLCKHYGQKVIILIDEYDVGCLRISKESIFTGLNNFNVHTISDAAYDEYFGFTDDEVRKVLTDYGMGSQYQIVKEWYDGYRFGKENVYCPWDVICYVKDHLSDISTEPLLYWANSSGNTIIKNLIEQANATTREQIETLISGKTVEKELVHELTYNDLDTDDAEERLTYLWSILYTTGYLTDAERSTNRCHKLMIPNREVRQIFEKQILLWFHLLSERMPGYS